MFRLFKVSGVRKGRGFVGLKGQYNVSLSKESTSRSRGWAPGCCQQLLRIRGFIQALHEAAQREGGSERE